MDEKKNEIILFENQEVKLEVNLKDETVWLNRQQLAELFDRDIKTIGKHINNALNEELNDDNSVVAKFATTAKENTDKAQIEERINLAYHSSLVDGQGKVTESSLESKLKKEFNKTTLDEDWLDKNSVAGKWKITIDNVFLEVPAGEETVTSARANITPSPINSTYTTGQEVTFGNENFFVLSDDGTTVNLLAKYCLNKAGTAQENSTQSLSGTGRWFSKTNYWSSIQEVTYPYDLQTSEMVTIAANDGILDDGIKNAVITARDYGISLGATKGRLMKKSEAEAIRDGNNSTLKDILWGTWNDATKPVDRKIILLFR